MIVQLPVSKSYKKTLRQLTKGFAINRKNKSTPTPVTHMSHLNVGAIA